MRAIRFRAFTDQGYVYFNHQPYIQSDEHEGLVFPYGHPKHGDSDVGEFIIEQFTGLYDRNKYEVYEGDIVDFDNTDIGGALTRGEVIWNDDLTLCGTGFHLWVIKTNAIGCHKGFMGMDWMGEITIVGNVNENKYLLVCDRFEEKE